MFKNWTDFWYAITKTNKYRIADEMCLFQIQYGNAYAYSLGRKLIREDKNRNHVWHEVCESVQLKSAASL